MPDLIAFVAMGLLLSGSGSAADEPVPPGRPPNLWLAAATQERSDVVIQISQAWPQTSKINAGPGANAIVWRKLRQVTLGATVTAYGVDGEVLKPRDVLRALEQPVGVAVFVRLSSVDPLEPPKFYLDLLREGVTVLVVDASDIFELVP